MSSSLPVSASVCPSSALAATQMSAKLNTASETGDVRLHCDVDSSVDRMNGTGCVFAATDTRKAKSSLSNSHVLAAADHGRAQASLSTSSVSAAKDSQQLKPLFPTSQTFAAVGSQQPQHTSQTSQAFPVSSQKSQSSLPAAQAFIVADSQNTLLSLTSSCPSTVSAVGSTQSQLSSTSAIASSTSLTVSAVKCEPAVSAAAASASHVRSVFQHNLLQGGHKPGKPEIFRDFSEHGKLREFCATSGKNCSKQSIFSLSFKYLCKTAVDWVSRIIRISGSSDPVQ